MTNLQRLRAEERRFWRERILDHASKIMMISTIIARVPGDDAEQAIQEAKTSLNDLESEIMTFQFIAPEEVTRTATRLHLYAMGYGPQVAMKGDSDGHEDNRQRLSKLREQFRAEVKKLVGVKR